MDVFGLGMLCNYDQRKLARYPEEGDFLVSTVRVTDSAQPFETAVRHPRYHDGKIVIVQMYNSTSEALVGHEEWVKTMTSKELPASLKDVSTCGIVALGAMLGAGDIREEYSAKGTPPAK